MTEIGVVLRWLHLLGALSLPGLLLVDWLSRDAPPAIGAWRARLLTRCALFAVLLFIASGLLLLAYQATVVTGRLAAAFELEVWLGVLRDTRFGAVWSWRMLLVLLLAALILARTRLEAALGERYTFMLCGVLAVAALGLIPWAGHAAAVEPGATFALASATLHLIAVALWFGALALLTWLFWRTAHAGSRPQHAFAALTLKRFSALAPILMLVLVGSGIVNAVIHADTIPALLGTDYGRLILLKLALLVPVLALAWHIRYRLLDRIESPAVARTGARLIRREWLIAALIVACAAALSLTPPGRHVSPDWPLPFSFSYDATYDEPGFAGRVAIGAGIALFGAAVLAFGMRPRARRRGVVALGGGVFLLGVVAGFAPLAVDAYPTTYWRTPAPYQALSIAQGAKLFAQHCIACHGSGGRGDEPAGRGLSKPPADLTAPHTARHTAGDLFWWLTHGIPATAMPGFAAQISVEGRWDVVNFLRALSAAHQARRLGERVEPNRPWLAAPDFSYTLGQDSGHALKDARRKRAVLLVFFTWPESAARIEELTRQRGALHAAGAELLALPLNPEALRGANPIKLPLVGDGQVEIAATYSLFRRSVTTRSNAEPPPTHLEFLIDRSGYLRARWIPGGDFAGWADIKLLLGEIKRLNREPPASPPDDHVH